MSIAVVAAFAYFFALLWQIQIQAHHLGIHYLEAVVSMAYSREGMQMAKGFVPLMSLKRNERAAEEIFLRNDCKNEMQKLPGISVVEGQRKKKIIGKA